MNLVKVCAHDALSVLQGTATLIASFLPGSISKHLLSPSVPSSALPPGLLCSAALTIMHTASVLGQIDKASSQSSLLLSAGLIHAGSLLTLQGAGAYDAAVHCASVSAARRILQQQQNPDGTLPQSMHSIQGQRHYDATQPIPVQVPPPGTSTTPAGSSGQSSSSAQQASSGVPRSSSSNNRSRKRWTGITRRMRTALCEMWTPNNSRPNNEEQSGQE